MTSGKGARIAVIGASLGGLVAAAELRSRGFSPVIIERGKTAGGLFNKVETPFGVQELGMHVVYVAQRHHEHLADIFGADMFNELSGAQVDIGASCNFGRSFFNSMYPCLLGHPAREKVLAEMVAGSAMDTDAANAAEELVRRFGRTAGEGIVKPIVEKLWLESTDKLTRNAIHCFFDLRRIVVCDKPQADALKQDKRLDDVIANPDQLHPAGMVFGGRKGITFRSKQLDLATRVNAWCERSGIAIQYESAVTASDAGLAIDGKAVADEFAACVMTMPVHAFAPAFKLGLDLVELSLYYFELDRLLKDEFPSYYILCHDAGLRSSRIVNYDAYNPRTGANPSVVAVEVVHRIGAAPEADAIAAELQRVLPGVGVRNQYRMPAAVKASVPSLRNAAALDTIEAAIAKGMAGKPLYFAGMRTDTGVFFSHHTIGLAYGAAVECAERLS